MFKGFFYEPQFFLRQVKSFIFFPLISMVLVWNVSGNEVFSENMPYRKKGVASHLMKMKKNCRVKKAMNK
jgi:hypothetical protein